MEERIRRKQFGKNVSYKYLIFIIAIIALLQLLALRACYQEKILKLPEELFSSRVDFPISELTLDIPFVESELESIEGSDTSSVEEDSTVSSDENQSEETGNQNLTDI